MLKKLEKHLSVLENNILKQEVLNQSVSASSVGWHIEHSLLTINLIIEALQNSIPDNYIRSSNFAKFFVFTFNKIPRGRAKAPRVVIPAKYNEESLKQHVQAAKTNIQQLAKLNAAHYFEHPYFGHLKVKPTIKFLEIHTNHHVKIINEIIKKK